jgi:hypothetical protein
MRNQQRHRIEVRGYRRSAGIPDDSVNAVAEMVGFTGYYSKARYRRLRWMRYHFLFGPLLSSLGVALL